MIRYALILILLLLASCSTASAATEPIINDTIWITTGDDVRVCQLPPGAVACVAVPPLSCKEIEDKMFIILDPDGLPLQSSPHTHVRYQVGDDECIQVINSTIYNLTVLAPTRAPFLWIFAFLLILFWKLY